MKQYMKKNDKMSMDIQPLPENTIRFKILYWINIFLVRMLDHPIFYWVMAFLIPDRPYLKLMYRIKTKCHLDLDHPVGYNQKLQWLKLYWHDPLATKCADKLAVRDYVAQTIGPAYLNEIYGVYKDYASIRFDELPESFVLKTNHGSGSLILCPNKSQLDHQAAAKKFKKWMRMNYAWIAREWMYKEITPRILAEKLMVDDDGQPPRDYKIYCFHGEPKLIIVILDRFKVPKESNYDLDWNFIDLQVKYESDKNNPLEKPPQLDEMLRVCRALSKPFPHVRVDLYLVNGQIKFGELTYFTTGGFKNFRTPQLDDLLGSWLDINKVAGEPVETNKVV